MKKILLSLILILLFAHTSASAEEKPSSWSMDVMGGASFGHFSFGSKVSPQGAINFRYSLNPIVSFYGTAGTGEFVSREDLAGQITYNNNWMSTGVGVRMNLLRMLTGPNNVTERIGVYTQTGFGLIMNDVAVSHSDILNHSGQDYSGNALLYTLGGGLTLNLSRRLDFFAQANFNFSDSDLLDGYERQSGVAPSGIITDGDAFISASAGISIKFGNRAAPHADWDPRDHRVDPLGQALEESLQKLETELDLTHTTMDNVHERVQTFERSLDDLHHMVTVVHSDQFMEYHRMIEDLQIRLQMLQSEIDELETQQADRVEAEERRFFVISGAFRSSENAQTHLQQVRSDGYENAEVIRDRNRSFYLVAFSGHTTEAAAASEMNRIRNSVNPHAWVYVK